MASPVSPSTPHFSASQLTNHPAMAQSIHDKQEHLKDVVREVTAKPESELTKEDASKMMSAEVCHIFLHPPTP